MFLTGRYPPGSNRHSSSFDHGRDDCRDGRRTITSMTMLPSPERGSRSRPFPVPLIRTSSCRVRKSLHMDRTLGKEWLFINSHVEEKSKKSLKGFSGRKLNAVDRLVQ